MEKIRILLLLFICTTLSGNAQTGSWLDDGNYDTSWYTGDKTAFDISTAGQLAGLCKLAREGMLSGSKETFRLTSDIDLSAHYWEAINPFGEVFDGQGYRIMNMRIDFMADNPGGCGLFGLLEGGTVRNVVIDESCGFCQSENRYDNAFFGMIACVVAYDATIENCVNNASIVFDGKVVYAHAGGIVGEMNETFTGIIRYCDNFGHIKIPRGGAGGITGYSNNSFGQIAKCMNKGNLTASSEAGGIIGCGGIYKITDCYNHGNILSPENGCDGFNKGGIAGNLSMMSDAEISGCVNYGDVNGNDTVSGYTQGGIAGIVGTMNNYSSGTDKDEQKIKNCINHGTISGANAAGIVGYSSNYEKNSVTQIIENCENFGTIDGSINSAGIISHVWNGGVVAYQCRNLGKVTATGFITEKNVGTGAVVYGIGSLPCVNCVNNGDLSASDTIKGDGVTNSNAICLGIGSPAVNCHNTGSITVKASTIQTRENSNYSLSANVQAAGISSGMARNCYNTGHIEGTALCSNASEMGAAYTTKEIYGICLMNVNPDKGGIEDLSNCYYSNEGLSGSSEGSDKGYRTIAQMRSPEFLALLNSGREDYRPNEYTTTVLSSCGWISDPTTGLPILDFELSGPTGITEHTTDSHKKDEGAESDITSVYNINGQKSDILKKGLNIIIKKDGTTKKVLLK